MSNETDSTVKRLNSIEQQLEQMVERKWTPLREKNDSDPLEIWGDGQSICVGHVNELWIQTLKADVIRTLDSGYYDLWSSTKVSVRPISAAEFYEIPDAADVRRAAVIKALNETGIHIPKVHKSGKTVRLKHFETEEEAERVAAVIEDPVDTAYKEMYNENVKKLEVREFEEPREWLAPDSWYSVLVHYE